MSVLIKTRVLNTFIFNNKTIPLTQTSEVGGDWIDTDSTNKKTEEEKKITHK